MTRAIIWHLRTQPEVPRVLDAATAERLGQVPDAVDAEALAVPDALWADGEFRAACARRCLDMMRTQPVVFAPFNMLDAVAAELKARAQ